MFYLFVPYLAMAMKRWIIYIFVLSMGNLPTRVRKSKKIRKSNVTKALLDDKQGKDKNNFGRNEDCVEFPKGTFGKGKKSKLTFLRKRLSFRKRRKVNVSVWMVFYSYSRTPREREREESLEPHSEFFFIKSLEFLRIVRKNKSDVCDEISRKNILF